MHVKHTQYLSHKLKIERSHGLKTMVSQNSLNRLSKRY